MTHHPRQEEPVQRAPNPRAEMIRGVGKGTSGKLIQLEIVNMFKAIWPEIFISSIYRKTMEN